MVDADTGEIVTPGQMLSDMDDAMAHAATVDQIEEIWNEARSRSQAAERDQG